MLKNSRDSEKLASLKQADISCFKHIPDTYFKNIFQILILKIYSSMYVVVYIKLFNIFFIFAAFFALENFAMEQVSILN